MARSLLTLCLFLLVLGNAHADEAFVPGTGVKVTMVGYDFEDANWNYVMNGRKASFEQDEEQRPPGGYSKNGRWNESAMRGQPDVVKRVKTPPGGLSESEGALLVRTKLSGIPGELSGKQMQDDLLMGVGTRLGRHVPVSWRPSCTVRVWLPPFHMWENRTGASFGVRADLRGRNKEGQVEPYWPGFFILFRSETSKQFDRDYAQISFRAQPSGKDLPGPEIYEPGWWTFGLSFTPDGQVHYYAHAGVEDLTADDHLYSSFAYGWQALAFDNFFVNVANWDNGETWSTPWVIDDPAFYVVPPEGQTIANLVRKRSKSSQQSGVSSAMKSWSKRLMR
jgi:hypothetical protein